MSQQVGYTVAQAAAQVGLSERVLREEIKVNRLQVRYYNTKALVDHDDLKEWFKQLPSDSSRDS